MRWVFYLFLAVSLTLSMSSCGGGHWDSYASSSRSGARYNQGAKRSLFKKNRRGSTIAHRKGNRRDTYSKRSKGPAILAFRDSYSVKRKKKKRNQYGNSQRKYKKRTKQRKHRLRKRSQQGIFQ